ncbi:MAG: carbohydrate ABC transporter permease [Tistrella sp.]|uniref:Maltose/maltodextrin ABC transporter permease protein MalG n=4 Tax=Tistrella mobilis TaxID=171437 RepID=I3TWJ4_TISMK|nr:MULTISPECIES: carbohydrate ABC transporter permease [Tistrella]AFK57132.1 maltose/maltodextrin ABC transporter permease protein MalG [Tistrella mobilis KA081020-065]MAD39910.1 carbohydrate ABC transporter permease [Tistrella sp.]MBA77661.1 carbohydrate ABC transporter permease [Tistrella sp.]|tara:strand:- start:42 stop:875 length:834 start_codon:yes stop_codon:yes gene_type:complete
MTRRTPLAAIGLGLSVVLLLLWSLFPLYYAVLTSMESGSGIFRIRWWPEAIELGNYRALFATGAFGRSILNSVLVAVLVVTASAALGLTAAHALGRIRFRGRRLILLAVLAVSMFPQVAVLSGMFTLIRGLGLYNSLWGLALAYLLFTLPFTVWVLTTFIRELPVEIEEAAIMDGAGPFTILIRIFLPLMWPAIVTTGLIAFIIAWNEFLFALTFTLTDDMRTVPVAIALLTGGSQHELPWGMIMAASVTVTLPLVALVLVFQRRLVAGLTAGAVKG